MNRTAALLMFVLVASAPTSAAAKTYAQELVDRQIAKHPEVVVMAMHVTPPKASENIIIASNIGRIGKAADEDDLRVVNTGKPNLAVNKAGDRFEAELVLQDASLRPIGALGVVFPYKAGDDKIALQKKAEAIRDDLRRRISHAGNLMETYPFDASIPTATFAQHLVDQALDQNPEFVIVATHVATPTNKDYPIIASNIGRIGKKADEDDMEVIKTSKPKLEVNESGDRFESEGVLRDSGGHVIGAVGVVFPYKQGDDQQALHKKADALREAWAKQIPDATKLFEAYPKS
jgi:hypothetical protein